MDVQQIIAMKRDVKPFCDLMRERTLKAEEAEKQARQKLMNLGALQPSMFKCATSHVFVRKNSKVLV